MSSIKRTSSMDLPHSSQQTPSTPAVKSLRTICRPSQQTTPPTTPPSGSSSNKSFDIRGLSTSQFHAVYLEEEPLVAVLGCGYVGTHLIEEFSSHYDVLGFDVSQRQIEKLKKVYGGEGSRANFTTIPEDLSKATHFLVSVPTLLLEDKSIDTSYIRSALALIARHARRRSTVVIESSVAVGMTRELVGPLAMEKGFFAGMSPERVDPGRTDPPMNTIPKVLSGLDDMAPGSLAAITRLYSRVFRTIIPVSKPEVAEMMKLYENCQRMICIAYANEMADACIPHGIDPYEVCRAAASKPFGYMPFAPSLGVGGHCIPVNPYYLLSNSDFPLLRAATQKMWQRPAAIGKRSLDVWFNSMVRDEALSGRNIAHCDTGSNGLPDEGDKGDRTALVEQFGSLSVSGGGRRDSGSSSSSSEINSLGSSATLVARARVLVVGVGFKAGQDVLSNSPGKELLQFLADSGRADVMFADPLVRQSAIPHIRRLDDESWNKVVLETFDMIIVAVKQIGIDFNILKDLHPRVKVQIWCA